MTAYIAYFTRDDRHPANSGDANGKIRRRRRPAMTMATPSPRSNQARKSCSINRGIGVVGAGHYAKDCSRMGGVRQLTATRSEGVMFTIDELKDAGLSALPTSRDPT